MYHHLIPTEPRKNVLWRRDVLRHAALDRLFRQGIVEMCRLDILFWIKGFVWQFNPTKLGREVGPFIPWDFQERALLKEPRRPWISDSSTPQTATNGSSRPTLLIGNADDDRPQDAGILWSIENQQDLFQEKSREMGVSWLNLLVFTWLMLFYPWKKFLCVSRNEKAVDDKEDTDSLFWKIDFVLEHLPLWMKGQIERKKLLFRSHRTNSSITGQATTRSAGVGGRATAMFVDEFSQIDEAYEVLIRTAGTSRCRIFCGTHRGTGTAFHELSQRVDMAKLVMHWTQHPDKKQGLYSFDKLGGKIVVHDKQYAFGPGFEFVYSEAPAGGPHPGIRSPWYDNECRRLGSPRAVAEEQDIDPAGSQSQFFDPIRVRGLVAEYCLPPVWEGDVAHDSRGHFEGLIPFTGGPLKLWVYPKPDGTMPRGRFGLGADISTGTGATNSCIGGGDAATGEKILEYATCSVAPEKFGLILCALGWMLQSEDGHPALICWEHKGPGLIMAKIVLQTGYPAIYFRESESYAGNKGTGKPGWDPGMGEQKRILLEEYRVALYCGTFINRSFEAMSAREILQYRYNTQGNVDHPHDEGSDDPTGARVNHGDRVIADALCRRMLSILGRPERKPEEERPRLLSLAWRRAMVDNLTREQEAWG